MHASWRGGDNNEILHIILYVNMVILQNNILTKISTKIFHTNSMSLEDLNWLLQYINIFFFLALDNQGSSSSPYVICKTTALHEEIPLWQMSKQISSTSVFNNFPIILDCDWFWLVGKSVHLNDTTGLFPHFSAKRAALLLSSTAVFHRHSIACLSFANACH